MNDLSTIYMHTSSGRKYFPFAPTPEMVEIEVIAHHLATRGRFAGATQHREHEERIFYSVAEHSVLVSYYLEREMNRPDLALEGLLHDASEAFNGDLIRPLKKSEEFSAPFNRVEALNEAAVAKRFNLPYPMSPEIKIADEAVCEAEIQQIVPRLPGEDWEIGKLHCSKNCAPYEIQMLLPHEAKALFLERYSHIAVTDLLKDP